MKFSISYPTLLQILLLGLLTVLLLSSPLNLDNLQQLREARLALDEGAYNLAASTFAQALVFSPWRGDLLLHAGHSALLAGDPSSAIQYFNQYATQASLPPDAQLALGDAYLASGNAQEAIQTWQEISEYSPYAEAVLLRLLELNRKNGDYQLAADLLKSLLRLHPNEPSYYYQLGLLLAVLEPDASLAYLSQVTELDSALSPKANELISLINTARLYDEPAYSSVSVGRWLGLNGNWQLALLAFQRAVNQRPDYAEAWAYLGEALQQNTKQPITPDDQSGLEEIQTALDINPDSVIANSLASIFWQRRGNDARALEYLQRAASLEPDNPMLQAELGYITANMGELPAAQAFYEHAAALAPTEPVYWRLLAGFSLDRQIQVRQIALPAARTAALLAPNDPESLDMLGKVLLALGDLRNAERFLRRAISIDPSFAPAHFHLGLVFLSLGDDRLAQDEFKIASSLAPDSSVSDQVDRLDRYLFP